MKKLISTVLAGSMMLAVVTPSIADGSRHGGYGRHGGGYYGGRGGYYGGHGYYYGHSSHHSDWSTVGQIMTGVLIGGALTSAYYSEPPRREIVYRQTVYQPAPVYVQQPVVVYAPPAPVQPVVYAPPAQPVVYAPPAQDVQPQPVRQTTSVTLWVKNSNGSQTPVVLRRAVNGQYIGPKGEYYTGLPANEQLRQLYGM